MKACDEKRREYENMRRRGEEEKRRIEEEKGCRRVAEEL
jgi:hypothetical protein